jgi:hypothetical protein
MKGSHPARSSADAPFALALLVAMAALALTACGGSSTTASNTPSTAPSEAAVMLAASPGATSPPPASGPGTIAFTKFTQDEPPDICVVHTDGTGLRRLAQGARRPAWSPDGSKIAFIRIAGNDVSATSPPG